MGWKGGGTGRKRGGDFGEGCGVGIVIPVRGKENLRDL